MEWAQVRPRNYVLTGAPFPQQAFFGIEPGLLVFLCGELRRNSGLQLGRERVVPIQSCFGSVPGGISGVGARRVKCCTRGTRPCPRPAAHRGKCDSTETFSFSTNSKSTHSKAVWLGIPARMPCSIVFMESSLAGPVAL